MNWRKSSWSTYNGNCVAVAAEWRKAPARSAHGNCVETASCACGARVRDSKDPDGPVLAFSRAEWTGFTTAIKAGEFT